MGSSKFMMERHSNILTNEELDEFLSSEKRLFNRRGSDDSIVSSSPLNPNAQEFVPTTQMEPSKGLVCKRSKKKTRKNNKSSPPRCCQYCLKQGYDEAMYGSHSMRKKSKELICPILLSNLCKSCGDTYNDRDIHEESHCPVRGFQPFNVGKFC